MSNLTFEIRTPKDLHNKLKEEYQAFSLEPFSSRHALNFAMTAFFLIEWIFYAERLNEHKTLTDFRQEIKFSCPEIQIIQDIATGTKHFRLITHKPKTKETKLNEGAFSSGFSKGFDTSYLKIEMIDGQQLDFEEVSEKVMSFWNAYFKE